MIRWQRMRSRRKREKRRSWRRRHDITFCSANVCGRLRSLSRSVLPFGGALRAPSSAAGTFCRSQGSLILEWDFGHGSRYRAWPIFLCPWPDFCLLWEPCSFLWGEEQSEKKKKKKDSCDGGSDSSNYGSLLKVFYIKIQTLIETLGLLEGD